MITVECPKHRAVLYRVSPHEIGDRPQASDYERVDKRVPKPQHGRQILCPECKGLVTFFIDGEQVGHSQGVKSANL